MANKSFGNKIKDARKSRGLSQRQLAEQVNIDYSYLSKIERGKVDPPSEKVLLDIAEVLEIDNDELLYLAEKAPSDLDEVITEAPYIPSILRRARGLTREDWEEIGDLIERMKQER